MTKRNAAGVEELGFAGPHAKVGCARRVNGTATNYGVILWATNEDTDGKDLRFRSSEYSSDQLYLEVTYSDL